MVLWGSQQQDQKWVDDLIWTYGAVGIIPMGSKVGVALNINTL